eukprot:9153389-Alexandrium_andersonii.AAC.1
MPLAIGRWPPQANGLMCGAAGVRSPSDCLWPSARLASPHVRDCRCHSERGLGVRKGRRLSLGQCWG